MPVNNLSPLNTRLPPKATAEELESQNNGFFSAGLQPSKDKEHPKATPQTNEPDPDIVRKIRGLEVGNNLGRQEISREEDSLRAVMESAFKAKTPKSTNQGSTSSKPPIESIKKTITANNGVEKAEKSYRQLITNEEAKLRDVIANDMRSEEGAIQMRNVTLPQVKRNLLENNESTEREKIEISQKEVFKVLER